MSTFIGIHSLAKTYGTQTLFQALSFTIHEGDRIGLIGPNGAGKSTLLKILAGIESPNSGSLSKKKDLRIGYASQAPEFPSVTVKEVLIGECPNENLLDVETRARILLGKALFSSEELIASQLSGGWKKRLDIVRAMMSEPDLLLLDEPTNHLDLEGIEWLEQFLARERLTYLMISHDRYFLEKVTNKTIEINKCYPNGLLMCDGPLSSFMEQKEAFTHAQYQQQKELAAAVRNELDWLRRSPKARTTKSVSRIQRAYALMEEFEEVKERNKVEKVRVEFSASERETRKLLVAKNVSKSLGDKQLFKGINLTLSPYSRIGIVGKNGTGKTTLLKILARLIPQDLGTVKYADDLRLVYFDQHREALPPHLSLREALSPTSDMVNYRGQSIHVNGWAKKFLFSADRMELPVGCLSGGERARIQIAKLMLEPADILFLDEPTNDLDISTLEVMEESLKDFPGAVVMITHDRCLMDRVCTQILGLGTETDQTLFADYEQWEKASAKVVILKEKITKVESPVSTKTESKKLTFKEQKEWEGMEAAILKTEEEISVLHLKLLDPFVQTDAEQSLALYTELAERQKKLEELFERWQLLEQKREKTS